MLFIGCRGGQALCATGHVRVRRSGIAILGARLTFLGGMIPSELTVAQGAVLTIGDDTIFNYGVSIVAHSAITIGRGCMFGSFVRLSDESFGRVAPVVLGDDVWVAHGIHFDDAEIGRLGAAGVGVAHCPSSNNRLAAGHCRVLDLEAAGVPVEAR